MVVSGRFRFHSRKGGCSKKVTQSPLDKCATSLDLLREDPPFHDLRRRMNLEPKPIQRDTSSWPERFGSCEGFPREGSSPPPGTIESMSYGNPISPEKAEIGVL